MISSKAKYLPVLKSHVSDLRALALTVRCGDNTAAGEGQALTISKKADALDWAIGQLEAANDRSEQGILRCVHESAEPIQGSEED